MKLRPYQIECVDSIQREFEQQRSTLVVMATGTGKSVTISELCRRMLPKRSICLAHRSELIHQLAGHLNNAGLQTEIEMAHFKADHSMFGHESAVVASVQTMISGIESRRMEKFKPEDFGLVVIDECFVAGTLVDGRPIEHIKIGDRVRTHNGYGTVTHTFRNKARYLVRLHLTCGSVTCTPNHPFFTTNRGWVSAEDLTHDDAMVTITHESLRHLWNRDPSQALQESSLQVRAFQANNSKNIFEEWRKHYSLSKNQRYAPTGGSRNCIHQASSNGVEAQNSEGEWNWADCSPIGIGVSVGMGNGIGHTHNDGPVIWIPDMLQSGYRKSRSQNRHRSGWQLSSFNHQESAGPKEGTASGITRMESREIFKQGCGSRFSEVCPDGFVYNLEVSNGNTYFANDILVHNCHHGTSDSYRAIIDYFKTNPHLKLLGVTATPDRADEEALGQIFETVAYDYDLENAISDGWLCDIEQHMVHINGLDYSQCRTTAGDLNGADLAQVMESESNLQGIAGATLDLIGTKRKTIVFTASVRQAEQTNNIFNRYHPGSSGWVHGAMPVEERNQTIRDFRSDKLQILVNVGVCLEGFDAPQTEVVVMGAATKSRARYTQAVGRATRPLPFTVDGPETAEGRRAAIKSSAKPIATVLDFVGNSGRHKLVSALDILGGNYSEETIELAKRMPQKGRSVRESLAEAHKELSKRIARAKQDEEARKARLVAKVQFTVKRIDPFSAFDLTPAPERAWDRDKHLTEKQKGLLIKLGVDPNQLSYSQGRQLLNEQFRRWNNGLCTMKQASLLKKHGYDTHDITMKEASILIDRIAANGWKRPAEDAVPA